MSLKKTFAQKAGYNEIVGPADMKYITMDFIYLEGSAQYNGNSGQREVGLVLLEGGCEIKAAGVRHVFERKDVFSDKASALYVPPKMSYAVRSVGRCLLAVCGAPSKAQVEPVAIYPKDVHAKIVGKDNWRREVHDIIGPSIAAERLLIGETFNPPGNWSSVPPHKHDSDDPPQETKLEEVYYFKISPADGFAMQRIYSFDESLDQAVVVKDNDVIMVRQGYHPVVALAGCHVYYLWVLAGEKRILKPNMDPRYQFILAA